MERGAQRKGVPLLWGRGAPRTPYRLGTLSPSCLACLVELPLLMHRGQRGHLGIPRLCHGKGSGKAPTPAGMLTPHLRGPSTFQGRSQHTRDSLGTITPHQAYPRNYHPTLSISQKLSPHTLHTRTEHSPGMVTPHQTYPRNYHPTPSISPKLSPYTSHTRTQHSTGMVTPHQT